MGGPPLPAFVLSLLASRLFPLASPDPSGVREMPLFPDFRPQNYDDRPKSCFQMCAIAPGICENGGQCHWNENDCSWECKCPDGFGGKFCKKVKNEDPAKKKEIEKPAPASRATSASPSSVVSSVHTAHTVFPRTPTAARLEPPPDDEFLKPSSALNPAPVTKDINHQPRDGSVFVLSNDDILMSSWSLNQVVAPSSLLAVMSVTSAPTPVLYTKSSYESFYTAFPGDYRTHTFSSSPSLRSIDARVLSDFSVMPLTESERQTAYPPIGHEP